MSAHPDDIAWFLANPTRICRLRAQREEDAEHVREYGGAVFLARTSTGHLTLGTPWKLPGLPEIEIPDAVLASRLVTSVKNLPEHAARLPWLKKYKPPRTRGGLELIDPIGAFTLRRHGPPLQPSDLPDMIETLTGVRWPVAAPTMFEIALDFAELDRLRREAGDEPREAWRAGVLRHPFYNVVYRFFDDTYLWCLTDEAGSIVVVVFNVVDGVACLLICAIWISGEDADDDRLEIQPYGEWALSYDDSLFDDTADVVHFALFFAYLLSLREARREELPTHKRHAKAARQAGLPPPATVTRISLTEQPKGAHQGGTHASPRLHLRRGHVRHFRAAKFKKTATWVRPALIGAGELAPGHRYVVNV